MGGVDPQAPSPVSVSITDIHMHYTATYSGTIILDSYVCVVTRAGSLTKDSAGGSGGTNFQIILEGHWNCH